MPYASDAQRKFFHSPSAAKAGIKPETVKEFDSASKGMKLPEKVKKMADGGQVPNPGFHLIEEGPKHFTVEHPNGRQAVIAKHGLSPEHHEEIRGLPQKVQKMAAGGGVSPGTEDVAPTGDQVPQPDQSPAPEVAPQPEISKTYSQMSPEERQLAAIERAKAGKEMGGPAYGVSRGEPDQKDINNAAQQLKQEEKEQFQKQNSQIFNSAKDIQDKKALGLPISLQDQQTLDQAQSLQNSQNHPLSGGPPNPNQTQQPQQPGFEMPKFQTVEDLQKIFAQGGGGGAGALSKIQAGETAAMQNFQAQQNARQAKWDADFSAWNKRHEDMQKEYIAGKIDPNQFWNQQVGFKGGLNRVLALVGLFLGGNAQVHTGVNPAAQALDKAIDENIDAQKANMGQKQNLLKMHFDQLGDMRQAELATRADMKNLFDAQMQMFGHQTQNVLTQSQINQQNLQNKLQLFNMSNELTNQQYQRQLMTQGQTGQGLPDQYVQMMPDKDMYVRVGPNQNLRARSADSAKEVNTAVPAIDNALKEIDKMELSIRGGQDENGKYVAPLGHAPDVWGLRGLTHAGREGENIQNNVIKALRTAGKSSDRLNEYTNENYLQDLVKNPAQLHTEEALSATQRLRENLLGHRKALISQNVFTEPTYLQNQPGFKNPGSK